MAREKIRKETLTPFHCQGFMLYCSCAGGLGAMGRITAHLQQSNFVRLKLGLYCKPNLSERVYGVQIISSFNKYLMRVDIMLGNILGARDSAANIRKSIPQLGVCD